MNNAKLKQAEDSLTGIAKKVLDAVPMSEAWEVHKIVSEIFRITSSRPDVKIVGGCLTSLRDQGLVVERPRGSFMRVHMKDDPAPVTVTTKPVMRAVSTPDPVPFKIPAPADPLDRLGAVTSELRSISRRVEQLSGEAEDAALAMQAEIAKAHADNAKLKQLQDLLKSIGQ